MQKLRKWLVSKIAPENIIIIYTDFLEDGEKTLTLNYKLENKKIEDMKILVQGKPRVLRLNKE